MQARSETLSAKLKPRVKPWAGSLGLIALFAALTALGARVTIPLPFTPVPMTLQVLFVLLSGLLLGSRLGMLSQMAYLTAGLIGMPIFAAGRGGPLVLLGPTGGYLMGFPLAAFVVGLISERRAEAGRGLAPLPTKWATFGAALVGVAAIYLLGATWLGLWLNMTRQLPPSTCLLQAWQKGVLPFIAVDTAKALIAVTIVEGNLRRRFSR